MVTKDENSTIKATKKLKIALRKEGVMGESFEDVIWRLLERHKKKEKTKNTVRDKELGGTL